MKTLLEHEDTREVGSAHLVEQRATAPAVIADANVSMFERLARDPGVGVDQLERLMAMHERMQANYAKQEFYADFARMQGELPTVQEKGRTNNGAYARHEDIIEAVRPVLQRHGFILTFRTTFPDGNVRVVGVLAHRSGHAEETEFISKPDTSGNKNAIQALGSAQSYGQRYTARALLNIASSESDDDGKATSKAPKPAPDGYEGWLESAEAVAVEGWESYAKFWNEQKSKPFRKHLVDTNPHLANRLQLKAKGVK